jgi:hypothetical protein
MRPHLPWYHADATLPALGRRLQLTCALLGAVVALAPAVAAAADGDWRLRAAGDAGEDDSRGASFSVDYAPADQPFSFGAAVQYAEAALAGPALPGDSKPQTVGIGVDAGWLFGPALVRLGFDSTDDEDFRQSDRWTAAVRVGRGAVAATAHVSRRTTDFDTTPADGTYRLRSGQSIALTGTMTCDVDDTGYGLALDWSGRRWDAYLGATAYDYDSLSCAFSADVPAELGRPNGRLFAALSAGAAQRFEPRAGGRIARDLQLLESEFMAGVGYRFDVVRVSLDWFHGEGEFSGVDQDDWSATLGFPLGEAWTLELTAGSVDFDGESSGYGGLALSVRL